MTITSNSAALPENHVNVICANSLLAAWGPSPELSRLLPSVSAEARASFTPFPGRQAGIVNQQTAVAHPLYA